MNVKQLLDSYVSVYPSKHEADLLARVVLAQRKGEMEADVECAKHVDELRAKAVLIASRIVKFNDRAAAEIRERDQRQAEYEKSKREAAEAALNAVMAAAQPSVSMFCDASARHGTSMYTSRCSNKAKHSIVVDAPTVVRADLCGMHAKKFATEPFRVSFVNSVHERITAARKAIEAENAKAAAERAEADANAKGFTTAL